MTCPNSPLLLDFSHISVKRGDNMALHDICLKIPLGQHVAILGPNGCGKSTLIKTVTRECYPLAREDAHAKILGKDAWNVFELRKHLGIVSSDTLAPDSSITCEEAVLSGFFSTFSLWRISSITDDMRMNAAQAMDTMGIAHLSRRKFCELSSGEARRVVIARALAHQPHSLLLDEPMANLDIKAAATLRNTLSRLAVDGRQIIMVTHNIADILPQVERVIMLKKGHIVTDGHRKETLTGKALSCLFEMDVRLVEENGCMHLI